MSEEPTGTPNINLEFPVDAALCDRCGQAVWIGASVCPHCGALREPGTEAEAHLYRARKEVFSPVAEALREPPEGGAAVPVSDWQYLRFLRDSRILKTEPYERMKEEINGLELDDPSSIRGRKTREAAGVLLRGTAGCAG